MPQVMIRYSWTDQKKRLTINPYWPFTVSRMVFYPDFNNKVNEAELYARDVTGIRGGKQSRVLPVFMQYLQQAIDHATPYVDDIDSHVSRFR